MPAELKSVSAKLIKFLDLLRDRRCSSLQKEYQVAAKKLFESTRLEFEALCDDPNNPLKINKFFAAKRFDTAMVEFNDTINKLQKKFDILRAEYKKEAEESKNDAQPIDLTTFKALERIVASIGWGKTERLKADQEVKQQLIDTIKHYDLYSEVVNEYADKLNAYAEYEAALARYQSKPIFSRKFKDKPVKPALPGNPPQSPNFFIGFDAYLKSKTYLNYEDCLKLFLSYSKITTTLISKRDEQKEKGSFFRAQIKNSITKATQAISYIPTKTVASITLVDAVRQEREQRIERDISVLGKELNNSTIFTKITLTQRISEQIAVLKVKQKSWRALSPVRYLEIRVLEKLLSIHNKHKVMSSRGKILASSGNATTVKEYLSGAHADLALNSFFEKFLYRYVVRSGWFCTITNQLLKESLAFFDGINPKKVSLARAICEQSDDTKSDSKADKSLQSSWGNSSELLVGNCYQIALDRTSLETGLNRPCYGLHKRSKDSKLTHEDNSSITDEQQAQVEWQKQPHPHDNVWKRQPTSPRSTF